jgi:hypothetical protein
MPGPLTNHAKRCERRFLSLGLHWLRVSGKPVTFFYLLGMRFQATFPFASRRKAALAADAPLG